MPIPIGREAIAIRECRWNNLDDGIFDSGWSLAQLGNRPHSGDMWQTRLSDDQLCRILPPIIDVGETNYGRVAVHVRICIGRVISIRGASISSWTTGSKPHPIETIPFDGLLKFLDGIEFEQVEFPVWTTRKSSMFLTPGETIPVPATTELTTRS